MMSEDAKTTEETKPNNGTTAEEKSTGDTKNPPIPDGPSLFNMKKPKDIRDGLANGVSNIAKGSNEFAFCENCLTLPNG
jgi:hypothetical protein